MSSICYQINVMTKFLGIEFAPLIIPLERRLQTLAVLQWVLSFLFLGFGCLFFSLFLLFTRYYWITLLYLVWYLYDRKTPEQGSRQWNWTRNWKVWKYFRDYFPVRLVKTADLDPTKNYILGFHPHGIMSAGAFLNFATEGTDFSKVYPGIKPHLLTLAGQFQFPYHREYFMTTGACSATKDSMRWLLNMEQPGQALVLVVGGAIEALEARPGSYSLNLLTRKGFVKIALQNGACLVPVFSFGENEMFTQVKNPKGSVVRKIQDALTNYLGFSPPFFHGRGVFNYTFGLLPFRRAVNTVVGSPIDVAKIVDPTQEQIDELHSKYVEALKKLFEDHKKDFGIPEKNHLHLV